MSPLSALNSISASTTDSAGNLSTPSASATDFAIDNTDPVISLTSPVGGEFLGGTQNVTWSTTDANPATVRIELSTDIELRRRDPEDEAVRGDVTGRAFRGRWRVPARDAAAAPQLCASARNEREQWERVAAGGHERVDQNTFFIRYDSELYEAIFGFAY